MLAESLLKNRVLEAVCEKNGKPRAPHSSGKGSGGGEAVLWGSGVPVPWAGPGAPYWYRGRTPSPRQEQVGRRMRELSEEHPRYGYRRITALLRREGLIVGKRAIQRLRRVARLRVPPSKRRIVRRGVSTGLPTKAEHRGQVWTWDFIADATARCGALRMLTILDEHTREPSGARKPKGVSILPAGQHRRVLAMPCAASRLAQIERAAEVMRPDMMRRRDNDNSFPGRLIQFNRTMVDLSDIAGHLSYLLRRLK